LEYWSNGVFAGAGRIQVSGVRKGGGFSVEGGFEFQVSAQPLAAGGGQFDQIRNFKSSVSNSAVVGFRISQ
jgi:hypothetical protein